jgi:ATP-dependent DNA helicase RecQ
MISGFGAIKIKQFGKEFINIIQDYCALHGIEKREDDIIIAENKLKRIRKNIVTKPDTRKTTFDLYRSGKTFTEIAGLRNLSLSTIEGHLAHFIENGEIDIDELLDETKQNKIREIIAASTTNSLQELKALMPFAGYAEIKWMIADQKFKNNKIAPQLPAKVIL